MSLALESVYSVFVRPWVGEGRERWCVRLWNRVNYVCNTSFSSGLSKTLHCLVPAALTLTSPRTAFFVQRGPRWDSHWNLLKC